MIADRAQETTNTTGTGTLTLAGAVAGYQSFTSAFTTGSLVDYAILSGTDWEVGRGVWTASGTTLARTQVLRSSNSNNAISVAAAAKVWADIGADTFTTSVQPFRNRILNGQFRHDQINESVAYTVGGATLDNWSTSMAGGGSYTVQRLADPDFPTQYCVSFACTGVDAGSAGSNYTFYTAIEGSDIADLKPGTASAETITISFDMRFSLVGTYGVAVKNSATNRCYIGVVTQLVSNAREKKILTLTLDLTGSWPLGNGIGLYVQFTLAAGSSYQTAAGVWTAGALTTTSAQANFMGSIANVGYLFRFQLEKGKVATPFEEVSYSAELPRMERYYQKAQTSPIWRGPAGSIGAIYNWLEFRTLMRTTPSIAISPSYGGTASAASVANTRPEGTEVIFNAASSGDYVFLVWTANARLV